jgi:hypothetical protein
MATIIPISDRIGSPGRTRIVTFRYIGYLTDERVARTNATITVQDISVAGDEVRYDLSYSRRLKRFLTDTDPYIRYSEDVSDVPKSILAVPLLSMLCPVAWLTGADVYVDEIDETFLDSLPALHGAYAALYPDAPFARGSTIHYKEAIDNGSRHRLKYRPSGQFASVFVR